VPWLAVVLVAAVALSAALSGEVRLAGLGSRARLAAAAVALGGITLVALFLRHEIGVRALAPSDQDRAAEWSAALHQWVSAPVFGVGPDRALIFRAADGSLAHFVHNEYLQIAADTGLVGLTLLGLAAVALVGSIRRADVLSSCAAAACVCWAIAGGLDFDWHLPLVGLLGGWCAGLAAGGGAQAPSAASAGSGSSAITRFATVCGSQPARVATRRRRSPT
jgi:hypothetical protein